METLGDLLHRRTLTSDEALQLLDAIALDQSDDPDDVHGRIRPSNVRVRERDGRLAFKVTLDDDSADPAREAPEQRRGEPEDSRTDVYLTGLLLHESLTGELPSRRSPKPPALAHVIDRALEKQPRDRFASVAKMVDAVEDEPEPEPEPTRAKQRPAPAKPRAGTERILTRALAFLAPLAVVGALYGAIVLLQDPEDDSDPTEESAAPAPQPAGGGNIEVEGQLRLTPPPGANGNFAGVATFATADGQKQIAITANLEALKQNEAYEVWLYNSRDNARSLGGQRAAADGTYQGAGVLPADFERYRFIDVSREKLDNNRAHSGNSVLRGRIADAQAP